MNRRIFGQEVPRMPDAPERARAAPMPKRVELPGSGSWWQRIITCWRGPKGGHLLPCQREFAKRAWEYAGKPDVWMPPGEMKSEDQREAAEERRAIQAESGIG